MSPRGHVEFLAASPNRKALLELLGEEPRRPSTLTDAGSFSRSTVHRNLDAFVDRGWVRKDGQRYTLTAVGARILDRYESLLDAVEAVHENRPLYDHLGDASATLPFSAVDDGSVVTASRGDPHAPVSHYADALATVESTTFYGVTPIVSQLFNDASRGFVESDTEIELVLDESTFRTSREKYPDAFATAQDAENLSLYVTDTVSFGLSIFDDRVFVGAYDDGRLRALLDGTSETLHEWALDRFAAIQDAAVEVGDED
jgi:predicted transcriptional regulator